MLVIKKAHYSYDRWRSRNSDDGGGGRISHGRTPHGRVDCSRKMKTSRFRPLYFREAPPGPTLGPLESRIGPLILKIDPWTQARSPQDLVQEGANLAQAQGTPYQKPKTPRIWPTIFWGPGQFFLFSFFAIKFYFIFPLGGGAWPPWPHPPWLRPCHNPMRFVDSHLDGLVSHSCAPFLFSICCGELKI